MTPLDCIASPEQLPGSTGPIVRRTHFALWGINLAVDLIVCRPLEWATFDGREDGAWQVETIGDQVVAHRLLRAISTPAPVARPSDQERPAPLGELATWGLFDADHRRVGTQAVMSREAWEALPLPDRPGGVWSDDGGHLCYTRPA